MAFRALSLCNLSARKSGTGNLLKCDRVCHPRQHRIQKLRKQPGSRFSTSPEQSSTVSNSLATRLLLIGTGGGFAGSLVGLGGGFVTIPMLVSFANFTQHQATATSLASVAATSFGGALTFWLSGNVDAKAAAILALPAIATVGLGAKFSSRLDSNTLKLFMGLFMVSVAPLVPGKRYLVGLAENTELGESDGGAMLSKKDVVLGGIGGITGFASGLFGVGGGSIMTPAIALCTDMKQHSVIGTSLAAMFVPSLFGSFQHYKLGNLNVRAAVPLAIGTCLGAVAGGKFALSLSEDPLRMLFGLLMFGLGARQARMAWMVRISKNAKQ